MRAQELLRLPNVTPGVLAGFEAALMAKRGDKDQRAQIKKLLFNSGACVRPNSLYFWEGVIGTACNLV